MWLNLDDTKVSCNGILIWRAISIKRDLDNQKYINGSNVDFSPIKRDAINLYWSNRGKVIMRVLIVLEIVITSIDFLKKVRLKQNDLISIESEIN